MKEFLPKKTVQLTVTGLVQGVGFRPFIYRKAVLFELTGWVENTNENVSIRVTGNPENIDRFINSLSNDSPPASMVEEVLIVEMEKEDFPSFRILLSHDVSDNITEISPDIAVCNECLTDIDVPGNRYGYAFVNCTNCGPRFTIIQDLPYDRARTTMHSFTMCMDCQREYDSIHDRRFHAQPTACSSCGPHYELYVKGKKISDVIDVIVDHLSNCIENGGVVLIKGLGGMHLACDAFNEAAVEKLRNIKNRDGKPFALLFRDLETVKDYAKVDNHEEYSLDSWRKPIVLLEMKNRGIKNGIDANPGPQPFLADKISSGLNLIGVMLPYMPIHYLLFRKLKTSAIVLTSGNLNNEPILTDNQQAMLRFTEDLDAIVIHNRDIYHRTDDSVARIIAGQERVFRRSRGYVPVPLRTVLNTEGIVAFGAELTNCFCIGKGRKAFLSQHIGDLQGLETTIFYEKTLIQFIKLFRIKPALIAVDMHPDYISTRTGRGFSDLPLVSVQHHHAHLASCMAEHHLDERVIGVAMDGTGYGEDGAIWGAEFMICDLSNYSRINHFEYLPQPGGDLAIEEPWRMAVSYLYKVFGRDFMKLELPFLKTIDSGKIETVIRMIDRKINCPLTSSAGRLFDAAASILGLCQLSSYQAQGPMLLESQVQKDNKESYPCNIGKTISFDPSIRCMVKEITQGATVATIATKFHNTLISVIFESANIARLKEGIDKVVLSGGVFQNKYLLEGTISILEKNNFKVYAHAVVPTNDGGIALGQLAVASKRRELKCV
jgi:hydrogenase maturation protein HypF